MNVVSWSYQNKAFIDEVRNGGELDRVDYTFLTLFNAIQVY